MYSQHFYIIISCIFIPSLKYFGKIRVSDFMWQRYLIIKKVLILNQWRNLNGACKCTVGNHLTSACLYLALIFCRLPDCEHQFGMYDFENRVHLFLILFKIYFTFIFSITVFGTKRHQHLITSLTKLLWIMPTDRLSKSKESYDNII